MMKKIMTTADSIRRITRRHVIDLRQEIKKDAQAHYFLPIYEEKREGLLKILQAWDTRFGYVLFYETCIYKKKDLDHDPEHSKGIKELSKLRFFLWEVIHDAECGEFPASKEQMEDQIRGMKMVIHYLSKMWQSDLIWRATYEAMSFIEYLNDTACSGADTRLEIIDGNYADQCELERSQRRGIIMHGCCGDLTL